MESKARTVLLIENQRGVRGMIAYMLRGAGYKVVNLPEGADPVACAEGLKPQVIVIGMGPRIWEGTQVVVNLQNNPRTTAIPIVAYATLREMIEDAARCANVKEMLILPFDLSKVEGAVAQAIAEPPRSTPPT